MKIEDYLFHCNDTYRYIFPILRKYGKDYKENMINFYKQGIFLDDTEHLNMSGKELIYILIDVDRSKKMTETISFFKKQKYFNEIYINKINKINKNPSRIIMTIEIPYMGIINKFLNNEQILYEKNIVLEYFQPNNEKNKKYFEYCRNVLLGKEKKEKIKIENEILNY